MTVREAANHAPRRYGILQVNVFYSVMGFVAPLPAPATLEILHKRPQSLRQLMAIASETWTPWKRFYNRSLMKNGRPRWIFYGRLLPFQDGSTGYTQYGIASSQSLGLPFKCECFCLFIQITRIGLSSVKAFTDHHKVKDLDAFHYTLKNKGRFLSLQPTSH